MTFSTNGSAVLLLFVAIFGVVSLSAALLVTTDLVSTQRYQDSKTFLAHTIQIVRDCVHVDGGSGCATFDQIASSQDIKRADAGVIHGLQPDPTHVKRAIPDGTTLTCDTTRAPLSKSAVKSAFIEKFCGRIDGEVFRQSGIDEVCTELITKMYMFVSTINGDWVSGSGTLGIVAGVPDADNFRSMSTRRISVSTLSCSSSMDALTRLVWYVSPNLLVRICTASWCGRSS
jgi:hypothetical protein